MKTFLKKIASFLAFGFVFYLAMVIFWGYFAHPYLKPNLSYLEGTHGHMYSRLEQIKETKDVDVLFLGSSHAYRGFDPRIFREAGISCFNAGSSSQSPLQTKVLMDRYLDQLNPKMVIYEVYPSTLSSDGVESSLDLISNDDNDWYSFKMMLGMHHIKTFNTYVFSVWHDLTDRQPHVEPERHGDDLYIDGGYVQRDLEYFAYEEFDPYSWKVNEDQLKCFEEIVQMMKARDIEFKMVFAPIAPRLYASNQNIDEIEAVLSKYGEFYDFNVLVQLDDSLDFFDHHHLNQNGVNTFNHKLIELLFPEKVN